MKVYFLVTDGGNMVVITDEETAKVFDAAQSGVYEGVDLYSENAAEQLAGIFKKLNASGDLNGYCEIYSKDELDFEEIKEELEDATLVFEN